MLRFSRGWRFSDRHYLVDNFEFHHTRQYEDEELLTWLMKNGGDCHYGLLDGGAWYEPISEGRDQFIENAYTTAKKGATHMIDSMSGHYQDVLDQVAEIENASDRGFLFESLRQVVGVLGFIPVVGDAIDMLGNFILYEVEISLVDDEDKEALRKEQILTLSISGLAAVIPGMTSSIGKAALSRVARKLNIKFIKKGLGEAAGNAISKFAKNSDNIDIEFPKLIDGSPNKKLDIDGNSITRKIEPDSKQFDISCRPARRRRRAPIPGACKLPNARDKVYQDENLIFATKQKGRKPTLYFENPEIGSGRLRQQHVNGPKIQNINAMQKHGFFESEVDADNFHRKFSKSTGKR